MRSLSRLQSISKLEGKVTVKNQKTLAGILWEYEFENGFNLTIQNCRECCSLAYVYTITIFKFKWTCESTHHWLSIELKKLPNWWWSNGWSWTGRSLCKLILSIIFFFNVINYSSIRIRTSLFHWLTTFTPNKEMYIQEIKN